jgi:hypothetical protein
MTRPQLPPEPDREVSNLKVRVTDLERILRRIEQTYRPEAVFSYSGPLSVATSGRWYSRTGGRLASLLFAIDTPGETATVLEVYKNANPTPIRTVTLPAGSDKQVVSFEREKFFPDSDYLRIRIVSAGAGAGDLTVQGQMI